MGVNLYEILGVRKNASQATIKKAYKKLAQENHPDKGGDTEKMKEIQQAYDVLGDAARRETYDLTGDASEKNIREDAIAAILMGFNALVRQPSSLNIIMQMKTSNRGAIASLKQAIKDNDKVFVRFERMKMRIKKKSKGKNMFMDQIQQLQNEGIRVNKENEYQMHVARLALKILDDYEDEEGLQALLSAPNYSATTTGCYVRTA